MGDLAFLQFPNADSRVLPVFPEDRPKTPKNPVMERTQVGQALCYAKIVPPATQIQVETGNDLFHTQPAAAAGKSPHPQLGPFDRFGVDADARIPSGA